MVRCWFRARPGHLSEISRKSELVRTSAPGGVVGPNFCAGVRINRSELLQTELLQAGTDPADASWDREEEKCATDQLENDCVHDVVPADPWRDEYLGKTYCTFAGHAISSADLVTSVPVRARNVAVKRFGWAGTG